jgi:hypothetical protein
MSSAEFTVTVLINWRDSNLSKPTGRDVLRMGVPPLRLASALSAIAIDTDGQKRKGCSAVLIRRADTSKTELSDSCRTKSWPTQTEPNLPPDAGTGVA